MDEEKSNKENENVSEIKAEFEKTKKTPEILSSNNFYEEPKKENKDEISAEKEEKASKSDTEADMEVAEINSPKRPPSLTEAIFAELNEEIPTDHSAEVPKTPTKQGNYYISSL